MREAAETADDGGMLFGIFEVVGRVLEQLHTAELIRHLLRMHERHVEKFEQDRIDPHVSVAGDGAAGDVARPGVAAERLGAPAKHVAGKLVEHDGQRQRAVIACFP